MKLLSLEQSLKIYDSVMRQNPSKNVLFSDKESSIIKGLSERFKALYEAKKQQQSFGLGGVGTSKKTEKKEEEHKPYKLNEGDLFIIPMSVDIPKPYFDVTEYASALYEEEGGESNKFILLSDRLFVKGTYESKYVYTSKAVKEDGDFEYIYSRVFELKTIRKEMNVKYRMQSISGGTVEKDKWVTQDQFPSSQSNREDDTIFLKFGFDGSFNDLKQLKNFYRKKSLFYHPDKFVNRIENNEATEDQREEFESNFKKLSSAFVSLKENTDVPRSTTRFKPTRFTLVFEPVFEDYTSGHFEDELRKSFRFVSDRNIESQIPKLIRYWGQEDRGNLILKLDKEKFDKFELTNKHALDYEKEEVLQRFRGNVDTLKDNEEKIKKSIKILLEFKNKLDVSKGYLLRRELSKMVTYRSEDLISKYAEIYISGKMNLKSIQPFYTVEYKDRSNLDDFQLVISNWFYDKLRDIGIYEFDQIQYVATDNGIKLYVDEATYGTVESYFKWVIKTELTRSKKVKDEKFSLDEFTFKYGESIIFKRLVDENVGTVNWILYPTLHKSSVRITQDYSSKQESFEDFMLTALADNKNKEVLLIGNVPFMYDDLNSLFIKVSNVVSNIDIDVNFRYGQIKCDIFDYDVRWKGDNGLIEPLMYYVYSRIQKTKSKMYLKPYKDVFSQKFIDALDEKKEARDKKKKKEGDKIDDKTKIVSKMFPNYPTKEQLKWQYSESNSLEVATCAIHIKSSNEVVINPPQVGHLGYQVKFDLDILYGESKAPSYLFLGYVVRKNKGKNLLTCSSEKPFKNNLFKNRKLIFEGDNEDLKLPKFLFTRGNLNKYGASLLIWYLKQFGFKVDSSWNIPIFLNGTLLPIGSWSGLTMMPKSQQNRYKKEKREMNNE